MPLPPFTAHMSLNLHDEINRNAVSLRDEQVVTSLLCFL